MKNFDKIDRLEISTHATIGESAKLRKTNRDGTTTDIRLEKQDASAGVGITGGTGTIIKSSVVAVGQITTTSIIIDLTGLASSTTALDIIGVAGGPAILAQINNAQNAAILGGRMTCLEVPAGGVDDIDLYAATEGTGAFDSAVTALTEQALISAGGAWTIGESIGFGATPADGEFLYLACGAAGTAATYTAGRFLIELYG